MNDERAQVIVDKFFFVCGVCVRNKIDEFSTHGIIDVNFHLLCLINKNNINNTHTLTNTPSTRLTRTSSWLLLYE